MVAFAKLLEQATSEALLDVDWAKNMEIIDLVRGGDITGKEAIKGIKKRMFNRNPNVAVYTLTLLEAIVKNCGGPVQAEVATRDFMDQFRRLVRGSTTTVKTKCLDMIQTWARAFEMNPKYKIVPDTYNILKVEGHQFPPMNAESDAMFVAEVAPEWAEGDKCYACRTKFTLTTRKHHCRRCGQLFCQRCSSKKSAIPKFGIEKDVRVCDNCYNIVKGKASEEPTPASSSAAAATETSNLTPEQEVAFFIEKERQAALAAAAPSSSSGQSLSQKEQELKEQEEMELALALSMSEAEAQPQAPAKNSSTSYYPSAPNYQASAPEPTPDSTPKRGLYDLSALEVSQNDPMARYLSGGSPDPQAQQSEQRAAEPNEISVPLSTAEDVEFIKSMSNGVSLFEQKLERVKKRGGGVASDNSIQAIFRSLAVMHPDLLSRIDNIEEEKSSYDGLKEKLGQIRSAATQLKEVQKEQQAKLEQQRAEQAMLEKIQLEQKMKLLEQQAREQRMMQRAMEERLRLEAEETRRQEEARQLAAQEKAVRMEQERLAQQQAELQAKRDHAEAARQSFEQQHNSQRINQMHMEAEAARHRAHAQQVLAAQQQFPYGGAQGQMAPQPAHGSPGPAYNLQQAPPQQRLPSQQQQQQQSPLMQRQQQPPMHQSPHVQQQQQQFPPPINQPPQHPGNVNRPPQGMPPNSFAQPPPQQQMQQPQQQQQQQQVQFYQGAPQQNIQMQQAPPGQYGMPQQQGYGMQQRQQQQGTPLAFQHQQPPAKKEPEPLISFD